MILERAATLLFVCKKDQEHLKQHFCLWRIVKNRKERNNKKETTRKKQQEREREREREREKEKVFCFVFCFVVFCFVLFCCVLFCFVFCCVLLFVVFVVCCVLLCFVAPLLVVWRWKLLIAAICFAVFTFLPCFACFTLSSLDGEDLERSVQPGVLSVVSQTWFLVCSSPPQKGNSKLF